MAQRRMFSKTIICSAKFLKMPPSTQSLYFHLGLNADDDGIVEAYPIIKMVGSSEDDIKILSAKEFIIVLNEDMVSFIKDWNEHNLIRADRKIDSKYKNLLLEIVSDVKLLESKSRSDATKEIRKEAMDESVLPYSFTYKIRQAFYGKLCPICNYEMKDNHKPTIQHNIPLSKGGKHELGNISVICHKCNVSIVDRPTASLNSDEVSEVWFGLSNVSPIPAQDRIGKDRLGKDRLGKDRLDKDRLDNKDTFFKKPTLNNNSINNIYTLYPSRDINNNNRFTNKSNKDKEKIRKLLKIYSYDDLIKRINLYISDANEHKSYIKNFSTFLNQLPEVEEIKPEVYQYPANPEYDDTPLTAEQIEKNSKIIREFEAEHAKTLQR